jgi:hypothetical protein
MTREYDSAGFRQTSHATERRFPCGRTRQVATTDWDVARRLLASLDDVPGVMEDAR